jgi:8-oxo-dGTP pyrophosphatase MutT (NUDIX family)
MPISDYMKGLRNKIGKDLLLMPSAAALVFDDNHRVLLAKSAETGKWMIPGGSVDPYEHPADAAVREMHEETGLLVKPTNIIGVYGGPELHVKYPNGDEVVYIMTLFGAKIIGGEVRPDGREISDVRFFDLDETSTLKLVRATTMVLKDAEVFDGKAAFREATWTP